MSKFNTVATRAAVTGPVTSSQVADTLTFNRGAGFSRDTKSELFLLGVANMVGESSFYESASIRDGRFNALVAEVAVTDPEWLTSFAGWLRTDANMRSGPLVVAAQAVKARLDAGMHGGNRGLVASVLQRADEPGEFLAYWQSNFGRKIPKPVKRGVGDAVNRLYNQWSISKYDTDSHGFRFADVLALTHAEPENSVIADVFKHAIERRYGRDEEVPESLWVIRNRKAFMALSPEARRRRILEAPASLKDTGITWEALSSMIPGGMDSYAWEAMIPNMGYMALLRNLRNFEDAGVSGTALNSVLARLSNPDEVAKSKQLPMRFLSAFNATKHSLRCSAAIEKALNQSLSNVPELKGRTLILVDRSGSMFDRLSAKTGLNRADSAAVFGAALALRAEDATLVEFGAGSNLVLARKGASILPLVTKFSDGNSALAWGTDTKRAVDKHFNGHDRIVILTDEQTNPSGGWYGNNGGVFDAIPKSVKCFTWNLAGYEAGHDKDNGNQFTFGGLSDSSFKLIPLLERGNDAPYPWELKN